MNLNHNYCCSTGASSDPKGVPACPGCGQPGRPVAVITLKHMLRPEFLNLANKPGFLFCYSSECEVVYFHPDGGVLRKPDLRVRVGLKETEAPVPICYCFGFTEAMVLEEIQATGKCSIQQRITAEVKARNCACDVRNPQGSCCLGNVNATVKRAMKLMAAEKSAAPA